VKLGDHDLTDETKCRLQKEINKTTTLVGSVGLEASFLHNTEEMLPAREMKFYKNS